MQTLTAEMFEFKAITADNSFSEMEMQICITFKIPMSQNKVYKIIIIALLFLVILLLMWKINVSNLVVKATMIITP